MESLSQEKISLQQLIQSKIDSLGWSQIKLSNESGVTPATISRLLHGAKNIKVENIQKILQTLNLLKGLDGLEVPIHSSRTTSTKSLKKELETTKKILKLTEQNQELLNEKTRLKAENKVLKKKFLECRRADDPPGLNPAELRRKVI